MAKAIIGITDWSTTRATLLELARRVNAGERLPAAFCQPGGTTGIIAAQAA